VLEELSDSSMPSHQETYEFLITLSLTPVGKSPGI
jgi:hypothetical protein